MSCAVGGIGYLTGCVYLAAHGHPVLAALCVVGAAWCLVQGLTE